MKRYIAILLALALMLPAAGCLAHDLPGKGVTELTRGGTSPTPSGDPTTGPSGEPIDVPMADPADALGEFGVHLLKQVRLEGENTLISPLSILSALAMTAGGADGETLRQMEATLGSHVDELNAFFKEYMASLSSDEEGKMSLANSVWFRDHDLTVRDEFLDLCSRYYSASAYKAPFDDSTVAAINKWCDEHTDGMIKEIIDRLDDDARLCLLNALAFDAEWSDQYEKYQVRDSVFTKEDGTQTNIELMYSEEHTYLHDELAAGFIKYYKGGRYAFAAMLPNEGISVSEYIDSLSGEGIQNLLSNSTHNTVKAAIPKFESEYTTGLNDALKTLGMGVAFDSESADFSKMGTASGNLFISQVLHKTFIEVGEQGTRAGAVTAVTMDAASAPIEPEEIKTVYLDRPFVYMLIDLKEDIPFFIGTVEDIGEPNGQKVEPRIGTGLPMTTEVTNSVGDRSITLSIPDGWEYDTRNYTDYSGDIDACIAIRPEGYETWLEVSHYTAFGVCGTGLEIEKVALPGWGDAAFYYYDGSDMWTFLVYDNSGADLERIVATPQGELDWYDDYEAETLEILGSLAVTQVIVD